MQTALSFWRPSPRFAVMLAAVLSAANAALPSKLPGQLVYHDFYYYHGLQVPLAIAADSLAIQLRDSVSDAVVLAVLGPGYAIAGRLPGRVLVVARAPLARAQLFAVARELAAAHDSIFRTVGALAHGTDERPPLLVGDQIIVRFQASVPERVADSTIGAYALDTVPLSWPANSFPDPVRRRVVRVTDRSAGDAVEVARLLHLNSEVLYAVPNFVGGLVPSGYNPADPLADQQWHLKTIKAFDAWDVTLGSGDITIAVLEPDGFDGDHPDLCGTKTTGQCDHLWLGVDENGTPIQGWDFENDKADVTTANEFLYHATAVAGLAAAVGDEVGVTGVCPLCKLMLVRTGSEWKDIADAVEFATLNGADVINGSWDFWWPSQPEEEALEAAATSGRNGLGIVAVFAMPNITRQMANQDRCDPATTYRATAALPFVLAVGGSTDADKRGLVSPEGNCLDLLAPSAVAGSRIGVVTTDPRSTMDGGHLNPTPGIWFTCPGGADLNDENYTNCFGQNSAAAPIVAGVAGLVLSVNPNLERTEVEDILRITAEKIEASEAGYSPVPPSVLGFSKTHGYGRVNALGAVSAAKATAPSETTYVTVCVLVVVFLVILIIWCWVPRLRRLQRQTTQDHVASV